jgi:hypothetical protein
VRNARKSQPYEPPGESRVHAQDVDLTLGELRTGSNACLSPPSLTRCRFGAEATVPETARRSQGDTLGPVRPGKARPLRATQARAFADRDDQHAALALRVR